MMSGQQERFEHGSAGQSLQLQFPFAEFVADDSWETLLDCVIRICDRHFSGACQQYAA